MFAAHLHTRSLAFLIGCIAVYGQTMPSSASGASQRPAPPEFSVAGVVHDPSGALIQGALVALKGRGAPEQSAATDAQGNFGFAGLPAGAYEIRVDYTGFKPYRARVTIRERSPAPRRIFLEIADLRDEITVDTGEARVNTDVDSNLDVVRLDTQTLENLPILGQDVIGALSQVLDPASLGSHGASLVVDGLPASEAGVPLAAIEEVRINQNPYSAEFARPGRGRIEITTKSGSSKYHGSFSFGLRDYRLDARNAFAVERPAEQRRQFEGYLSGPFLKSKNTSFLISAGHTEGDLQSIVYALGLNGPIRENTFRPQRNTYVSAQLTRRAGIHTWSARYYFFDWWDRGAGVGGVKLPELATDSAAQYHQVFATDRAVITPKLLNEFLVRVRKENGATQSEHPGLPRIVVLDAFSGGGAQTDQRYNEDRIELSDIVSSTRGNHFLKAGVNVPALNRYGYDDRSNFDGTFHFSSLNDYVQGRPFSFERQQGDGHLAFWEKELGFFAQDQMRVRPNLSVAYGLRYDWQNYISAHHNFAPRLSFVFAPGKNRKTVFRAGAGIFYDNTGSSAIGDTLRFNGARLHQVVLTDPGYPDPIALGGGFSALPSNIVRFASNLQSPYNVQYSAGMERQVNKSLTWTASYAGVRGIKLFRSRDLNAPPPFYVSRPDPSIGVLRQIESSGRLESNSLETTLRGQLSRFFNGTVLYALRDAYDNTDGINSLPANNYDFSGEWSRARFDSRHLIYIYGTLDPGRFFKLGVVFTAHSGRPYSITTGRDDNHDGFANDRPAGVPRNSMQAPGFATLDLRWSRQLFGRRHKKKEQGASATLDLDAFNVLNRVNYGAPVGTLSSPFLGRSVSADSARRVQVSLSYKF